MWVWVFDATNLDNGNPTPTLGGVPITILTLFGDTPRALAASPGGGTVYAAVFHSGNQTNRRQVHGTVQDPAAGGLPADALR
jgi:hypothetical protein